MKRLDRLVLTDFGLFFLMSVVFFALLLQVGDLFPNVVRYVNLEVPLSDILRVQWLFMPRALAFAAPIAVLFAASFVLGSYYARNEIIGVLSAGVPFSRFVRPLLVLALLLSAGLGVFEEFVVIPTFREKNNLSDELLGISSVRDSNQTAAITAAGRVILYADRFRAESATLLRVTLIELDDSGGIRRRIDGDRARWDGSTWVIEGAEVLSLNPLTGFESVEQLGSISDPRWTIDPAAFSRESQTVDDLTLREARQLITDLRESGLPFRSQLVDFHGRIAFALTPFIVALISCGIGSRMRKSILLLSLGLSLGLAVLYYVAQLISSLAAEGGVISPIAGAWLPVLTFLATGIFLFRSART